MTELPEFNDPESFYIIDLSCWVHRFWHAAPSYAARNFAGMLEKIINLQGPARLAIAEDNAWPTFRHELLQEYKANRASKQTNDERISKLEQLNKADAFAEDVYGVRRLWAKGFEADDVVATLATWGAEEGLKVVIVATDKDFMQLVRPGVVMWDGKGPALGIEHVQEKLGVSPVQVTDYLAIVGDKTDNLGGIRGIGEKGAQEILARFGRLDVALHVANEQGPETGANHPFFVSRPKLWAKLVASQPQVDLMRKLVRLVRDVPLPIESLDELALPAS